MEGLFDASPMQTQRHMVNAVSDTIRKSEVFKSRQWQKLQNDEKTMDV